MESVSFTHIGIFIGCLVVLVGLALAIKLFIQRDPPLHREYVSREEWEKRDAEVKSDLARHAASRKGIYDRLEEQGRQITSVQAEVNSQTRQLNNLDTKMDRVLERLPRKS